MCDYCGCRNQPEINELSDEHERLLDLAYELRRLGRQGSYEQVRDVIDGEFAALLDHHTTKEERGLFSQLRMAWGTDQRLDSLIGEHRDLDARVAVVRFGQAEWRDVLATLVDDLDRHILDEEVDLFPYAMSELRDEHWERVQQVHADASACAWETGAPLIVAGGRGFEAS